VIQPAAARATAGILLLLVAALSAAAQGTRAGVTGETDSQPSGSSYNFSVTGRPLTSIEELGVTGSPIDVDPVAWRLSVRGPAAARPVSLTYKDLAAMPRVNRVSLLICPGFFEDVAEWGGVPIADLLALAGVTLTWKELVVTSVDGYPARFSREEVDAHVLFVALTVNGQELPKAHGFPARLVAEGILGGQWVKWISSIEVK
jgi:DMSO/TMAO reductase YedYZ molybdopterin-dependent catalytic subunit